MRIGIREMVFFLVLMGLLTAYWWFVANPMNIQIAEGNQEIIVKQQKLRQLEAATQQIEDLGKEIDKLTSAIQVFEAKLPEEKEVEVILKEVWQLAAKHGLKPRSVRAEKPIKSPRHSELPLKMVIAGDFDGFYSFLLDVERLSRITRIPQMQLTKLSREASAQLKDSKEGAMEAAFTLSIFFEPGDKEHAGI